MNEEAIKTFQRTLMAAGYDLGRTKDDGLVGNLTRTAAESWAKSMYEKLGYKWYQNTIIGIRQGGVFTDRFSDVALVIHDYQVVEVIPWTTKAGKYYVSNPLTVGGITGTGIIKEGQHVDSHRFTTAANKYRSPYFAQVSNLPVYRDGNKDNKLDKNVVQVAPSWYAFLLHQMGEGFSIWNWSAGCNGTPKAVWLSRVCPYFINGQVITYTILEA